MSSRISFISASRLGAHTSRIRVIRTSAVVPEGNDEDERKFTGGLRKYKPHNRFHSKNK